MLHSPIESAVKSSRSTDMLRLNPQPKAAVRLSGEFGSELSAGTFKFFIQRVLKLFGFFLESD